MSYHLDPLEVERRAENEVRGRGIVRSALPDNPALGPDASALRARFKSPLELLIEMANDESLPYAARQRAAIAALPYMHIPQTVTQRVQGDAPAVVVEVDPIALAKLSPEELEAAEKVYAKLVAQMGNNE